MDSLSTDFYHYLCDDIVGSPEVVRHRRNFFQVVDDMTINEKDRAKIDFASSGSKVEGLNLPGSDLDVMYIFRAKLVHESIRSETTVDGCKYFDAENRIINKNAIILDTSFAQPGFALLRLQAGNTSNFDELGLVENTLDGNFIASSKFRLYALQEFVNNERNNAIHGPCITDENVDNAYCLPAKTWPSIAGNWIFRPRSFGWPSEQLITHIVDTGVLLVPIGSKSSSAESHPLEWRISYSLAEKLLIYSFSHSQLLCYATLKIILKDIIKQHSCMDNILCSYFLKTTIFWLSEEIDPAFWTPSNLFQCVMLCIKRISYWITRRFIPNYFIPQHNMIDRQIPGQSFEKLELLLETMYNKGYKFILLCESLSGFRNTTASIHGYTEFEKAILPLIGTPTFWEYSNDRHNKIMLGITRRNIPKSIRDVYMVLLAKMNKDRARDTFAGNCQYGNKAQYMVQREWMYFALTGTYTDSVSGWLILAVYFYANKRYNEALLILEHTRDRCGKDMFLIDEYTHITLSYLNRRRRTIPRTSFQQLIRTETLQLFILNTGKGINFYIDPYINLIRFHQVTACPTLVFIYYMRFLCHHQNKDMVQCRHGIRDLELIVDTDVYFVRQQNRFISYMYLVKAWSLMGDAQMTIASLCKGMKTAISVMEAAIVDSPEEGFANITLLEQFRRSYDRITLLGSYINAQRMVFGDKSVGEQMVLDFIGDLFL